MVNSMSEGDESDNEGQPRKRRQYREFNEAKLLGTMHLEMGLKFRNVDLSR